MNTSYKAFEKAFGCPILPPSHDLFEFDDVRNHDIHHVWTVIDGEGDTMWVTAGFHVVNKIGYLRTSKPWITGDEEYRWDD